MRQRIARGETRLPPFSLPSEPPTDKENAQTIPPDSAAPTALTPLGTRITSKEAFTRLDVDEDGKVTPKEFQRSPGMGDPDQAREVVTKVDQDGDGVLSFIEFNEVFVKRHSGKPTAGTAN